jgi:salicylate hydroxylase
MAADRPVLIAGGGIGGLALALALAQRGRSSLVLERRGVLATEGAGIQLGPNGVRVLRQLGIADALRPHVGEPDSIEVHDGRSGRTLASLPLGDWLAARHGAPYWVAHRGDLHAALLAAAGRDPRITVRSGCEVASAAQTGQRVQAMCASGETVAGEALVGADGLWSSVRRAIAPGVAPQFVGATATRAVIPASQAGSLAMPVVGLWLTPGVHVVHYPVRQGSEVAVVVIAAEDWQGTEWDAQADGALLRSRLEGFHPLLADVLARVADWRKWALHRLEPLPGWTAGRITLLGDAAHPMLPYLAQGGVMAMEDALVLARCLADGGGGVEAALLRYEDQRRTRAGRVQALSLRNGRIYHMRPPLAWARNGVLRLLPGARLMAGFDWLYGWQPEMNWSDPG